MLFKHWRPMVGLPVLAASATAALSFLIVPTYTATTTFVPEIQNQPRLPARLAGLASQFGPSLGTEATHSPQFYAEVVKSRQLLERVLLSRYLSPLIDENSDDSTTLLRILRVTGRTAIDSLHRGVKALDKLVSVNVNNQTNVVRLSVETRHPDLSAAVANRLVEYLDDFNTKTRQSQARERRKFVEDRIVYGERELRIAEEELKRFYQGNRSWQQAPQLAFEEGRLRRQVEIQQEVYITLKREYETARIEEVNDTPVLTVIDAAVTPQETSKPKRSLLVVLALLFGVMAGSVWIFGSEYLHRPHHGEAS
jgi:uncharacterized protein involved in exopolysaccharide biosynthesis